MHDLTLTRSVACQPSIEQMHASKWVRQCSLDGSGAAVATAGPLKIW